MRRVGLLLGLAALVGSLGATCSEAAAAASAAPKVQLHGDGIASVTFGRTTASATSTLQHLIGRAPHPVQYDRADSNCGYDAFLRWPTVTAWFDHGRFVGYAVTKPVIGTLVLATVTGLRVGSSLESARRDYGSSLRSSSEQGGAIFISTRTGLMSGLLSNNSIYDANQARVLSIGAGVQGCPAMEP